jgi:hypothetical protein
MTTKFSRVVDDPISRDMKKRWGSMELRLRIDEERLPVRAAFFILKSGVNSQLKEVDENYCAKYLNAS